MANAYRRTQATSTPFTIEVEGMGDFAKALRAASQSAPEALKRANYDLGSKIVKDGRRKASTRLEKKAAKSLRASRAASNVTVSGGGARYPFFYGAEFGAKQFKQFKSWRGNQWGGWSGGPGYFLHPAIRANSVESLRIYWDRINEITDEAFPD